MKIIDKYLLKSFLITFATVFVILFFIFILQSIWLFIAELAGKDLDALTIFKFIFFYSPIMVPLVLPLSILLASIMTFGSFAENYEFAAMKSGGISLGRAMKYLIIATFFLSCIAFLFANNIIPEAQYRFINLRKSIIQTKPAMAIGEGQFSKIGPTTTIRVEKKSGENGSFLEGITMHMKKGEFGSVTTVIKAKKGILKSDESTNLLQLELLDGNYYEDIQPKKIEDRDKLPFAKSSFKKYTVTIDLAKLNGASEEGAEIVNAYNMLNMSELKYTIDSLQTSFNRDVVSYSQNIDKSAESITVPTVVPAVNQVEKPATPKLTDDLLTLFPLDKKRFVCDVAKNNINNTLFSLEGYATDLVVKKNNINDHWIGYYDKILIAYSCLLMFFLGAPLGAIIRKGGLGLPIVFAVLIFIIFNFANTFGKKLAGQDAIYPFLGTAAGALILTPFAILFTYRATKDMGLTIDIDWLIQPIKKRFSKSNTNHLPIDNNHIDDES
jgi:lipopolysaccharide export system permease protein